MTLYLKYRPKTLDELDQEAVRATLRELVESGDLPHAFLFSGPKGIGKTSAARILAKIINCPNVKHFEPCNKCEHCLAIGKGVSLDVIELDAASHRGIDDVRLLRDAVKLAPASLTKKIYIIDEAHMLTTEASNALLKTLEEPPDHVIFILATTNPEKLIDTIRSRTVNILFQRATVEEIVRSLTRVAKGEKIKVEKDVLAQVAGFADGSFRDAVKLFEQVATGKEVVDAQTVQKYFAGKNINLNLFFELLASKDTTKLLQEIEKSVQNGIDLRIFIESLLTHLRLSLLAKLGVGEDKLPEFTREDTVYLIKLFSQAGRELPTTLIEQLPLELVVVEWSTSGQPLEKKELPHPSLIEKFNLKNISQVQKIVTQAEVLAAAGGEVGELKEITDDIWKRILAETRPVNTSIEALLRAARPLAYDGKTLTLGVFYKFHKERLEEQHHRVVLETVVGKVLHAPVRIICTLTEPPAKKEIGETQDKVVLAESESPLTKNEDEDIIRLAKEIFGN